MTLSIRNTFLIIIMGISCVFAHASDSVNEGNAKVALRSYTKTGEFKRNMDKTAQKIHKETGVHKDVVTGASIVATQMMSGRFSLTLLRYRPENINIVIKPKIVHKVGGEETQGKVIVSYAF